MRAIILDAPIVPSAGSRQLEEDAPLLPCTEQIS